MDQAVARAHVVDEGAEVDGLYHLAVVDGADLGLGGDAANPLDSGLASLLVDGGDLDRAVVIDVDLGPRDFTNLADHLATRANDLADLIAGDGDDGDARRVLADRLAGRRERPRHFVENMQTAVARLGQGEFHDLLGDRGYLDVHLQRRQAVDRARHLEVHVAQVVLVTDDVGEHGDAVGLLNQSHGDAGDGPLQRHPGIHHGERRPAYRGHRRRAIGFGDLGDHADCIGKDLGVGKQGINGAPCQLAVTDLSPARPAQEAGLADRIGRKVIMQHELLTVFAVQGVHDLFVLTGAQSGHHQGLSLATGEQRAAVGAGQDADLAGNRADGLGVAPVDAPSGLQDIVAHDGLLKALEGARRHRGRQVRIDLAIGRQFFPHPGTNFRHLFLAGRLVDLAVG